MDGLVYRTEREWRLAHERIAGRDHWHRQTYTGDDGGPYMVRYDAMNWAYGKYESDCCIACCPSSPGRLSRLVV